MIYVYKIYFPSMYNISFCGHHNQNADQPSVHYWQENTARSDIPLAKLIEACMLQMYKHDERFVRMSK